jgi:benzoyl-CoA reductase/2-hydroxyglutaryl-CoA dehydratase subunit BcrC/BadD/HgdB
MQINVDAIQETVKKASKSSLQCVQIVSLKVDSDSPLKTPDGQKRIQDAGISGVKDVGKWIVKSVEEHLKEAKTAQMLKRLIT